MSEVGLVMVGIRSGGDSVRPERTPVTASQVRIDATEGPAIGHRTDASRLHTHASASSVPAGGPRSGDWRNSAGPAGRDRRDRVCPVATVRAAPAGLLLLCLLFRSSWLMVEGGPHGAAGVPHRRGGRAALAGSVSVGWWRSNSQLSPPRRQTSEFSGGCGGLAPPARRLVLVPSESEGPDARYAMSKEKCSAGAMRRPIGRKARPSADRGVLAA